MRNKRKVILSPTAQRQYLEIRDYLKSNWTESVLEKFEDLMEQKINQVSEFPKSCPESKKKKGIHKAVVEKNNSFFFRIKKEHIQILIFIDNRMDPNYAKKQLKNYGR